MERYQHTTKPGVEILKLTGGFPDIMNLLRDQDRRPVRDLFRFLLLNGEDEAPVLYLGGSATNPSGPQEYGDIDLLAVFRDQQSRLNRTRNLLEDSKKVLTPKGIEVPVFSFGKTQYLVTFNGKARQYLQTKVDESFLLEPFRESPAMGAVVVASPIELCLSSRENFERDYRKAD